MEGWERIKYIIENEGHNMNSFSKAIGLSNNVTITRIINEKRSPSATTCRAIVNKFPRYNYNWLLTGDGEMLNNVEPVKFKHKGVPYYEDIPSTGSIMSVYNDVKEVPTFYIDYEHFNDCTVYLQHVGDSMSPKYCAGEILALKQINNLDIILWGEAYMVVTNSNANDLRTIKLLYPHSDNSKIVLRAVNPDYKGDTVINKEDILGLYIVKGKITRNQL